MQGKFTKDSEEYRLFADYYAMIKEYYIPENSEAWWGKAIDALNGFYEAHTHSGNPQSDLLCKKLGKAWMDFLTDSSKAK